MMREAQWKNKNITELYMPGSVFKLITASAGLDSGVMSAEQSFYCNGSLTVNEGSELWEHTYRCANGEVHYEQDMAGALNHSCNLWFIQAAETLKPQIFYDYIQAFGFTQPTGIDLPNETRWTSVYNAEQMAEVDTKPVHGGLRPERVHHPDADGHRRSGHRQRRLPCYALCRGFHL